jgi:hypothetical protein
MSFCYCQSVQTITDRKDILIGEQIELKIKAKMPLASAGKMNGIQIPDSITHFDIIETGKIDTIEFGDNSKAIEQTIIFTSFDSGRWIFPALPINFAAVAGQPLQKLQSDSFFVNVSYSPPDSTNQLRDIKPIIKVSLSDYTWYYIIGGSILLLLIAILLYRYFKKRKKIKPAISSSNLSPVDEAMMELKKLAQYNLYNADEIKLFHTGLAAVFKNYLGRKLSKNLINETTSDLLISIKKYNMQPEDISKLATALRCTDAVKFAKYLPQAEESNDCLQKIIETIKLTESSNRLNL